MKLWTRQTDPWIVSAYSFDLIDGRMYLLRRGKLAYVIDPHVEASLPEDMEDAQEVTVILTHEHFDHISGVNWLKALRPVKVLAGASCAQKICREDNGTKLFPLLFIADREKYRQVRACYTFPYTCTADESFSGSMNLEDSGLLLFETPGHSSGGICILLEGKYLFSGDTLLGNGEELRSPDANKAAYLHTLQTMEALSENHEEITVFPGHGEPQSLKSMLERIKACL